MKQSGGKCYRRYLLICLHLNKFILKNVFFLFSNLLFPAYSRIDKQICEDFIIQVKNKSAYIYIYIYIYICVCTFTFDCYTVKSSFLRRRKQKNRCWLCVFTMKTFHTSNARTIHDELTRKLYCLIKWILKWHEIVKEYIIEKVLLCW